MQKAITPEQRRVLESLVCERLSASPCNLSILNRFVQTRRGDEDEVNVLDYAKKYGSSQDENGTLAYYLIKTKSGDGLFFFSLKCGELFVPLTESIDTLMASGEFDLFVHRVKNVLKTSVEFADLKDELRTIIVDKRKQMPSAVIEVCKKYGTKNDILEKLEDEKKKEGNKRILRVFTTNPGVQIVHFCRNDLAQEVWRGLGLDSDRPMGEVLFWFFVAPIVEKLRALVGCEYAFLFAADTSDDNSLMKYYAQSLGFCPRDDLGVSKPFYDWTCTFMSLDITKITSLRKHYLSIFNSDKLPFEYADLDSRFR